MSNTEKIHLYIPGPVDVAADTMEAFASPMIGHRSKEFQALFAEVQPLLQDAFRTTQPCYVSTSSAWGMMEGALRNLVAKKVLNCCCGAFSDKWFDVAKKNGKEADAYQVEWGQPILPDELRRRLATGAYDAVTLVHNETSTGVMNPLEDLAAVLRDFPDVIFIVDTVSSFTVKEIPFDELGIDLMLAGTQKALALPAGACVFTASEKAYAKAETLTDRGYYFDLLEFRKNAEKSMTPTTPSISHFYALRQKLRAMQAEGWEHRYARHRESNQLVRQWARERGLSLFPAPGFESLSLTCVANTQEIDIAAVNARLRERYGCVIDGGYGKIKGTTFRISNMGDESVEAIRTLLHRLDECLEA